MRSHAGTGLLIAMLLSVSACGDAERPAAVGAAPPAATDAAPGPAVTVPLEPESESGPSATATLREAGSELTVSLHVGSRHGAFHAHIHDVTCREYRRLDGFGPQLATVSEALADTLDGTSVTVIAAPPADLRTAGYSVNVHELEPPYAVVACGDITG